jgi:hypothetical protein
MKQYHDPKEIAKGNLADVLESNGVPQATFFNSLKFHNDHLIQSDLHTIDYEAKMTGL